MTGPGPLSNSAAAVRTERTEAELRALIRRLPRSRRDAEQHAVLLGSLGFAVLAHVAAAVVVAFLPEAEAIEPIVGFAPPLSVEVAIIETPEEAKEEPTPEVVIEPEPPRVEPVDLALAEPPEVEAPVEPPPEVKEKPPEVKPPPKPRVKRRRRVARRAPKKVEKPNRPAAAAAPKPVKVITSPTKALPSTGQEGPTVAGPTAGSVDPAAKPGTGPVGEPGGDPNGSRNGTDSVTDKTGAKEGADIDLAALRRGYISRVTRAVHRRHRHPRAAIRAGLEGRVVIEVTIDGSGRVIDKRIAESSGHDVLDRAALAAISAVGQFPTPPSELHWNRKSIKVPFNYRMKRRS